MDPVKMDEIRKKRKAELKELKAGLKKLQEKRFLPGAKVTDGAPNKIENLLPFIVEAVKKHKTAAQEAHSNREPPILRIYSQDYPCCTATSPPAFSEDGDGKEA